MATLSALKRSISEMPFDEAVMLVKLRRQARRDFKQSNRIEKIEESQEKATKKTRAKTSAKKAKMVESAKTLTPQAAAKLLEMLKGQ
jgi:uncharacterized surface protein with fasciclin (FAS1) repeats